MTETTWAQLQRRLLQQYDDLKRRLARHLGSSDLAGDALQDTWLRLEQGGSDVTVRSPDSYIFRVAVNIARDRQRTENRRLTTGEVDALLNIADDRPDAAEIVEARSDLQALKLVMDELPSRQRAILVAARLDGLPRREIAKRFGVSERFVQRELREAQDYCAERLRILAIPRYRPQERETSIDKGLVAASENRDIPVAQEPSFPGVKKNDQ